MKKTILLFAIIALALTACAPAATPTPAAKPMSAATSTPAAKPMSAGPKISIEGVWGRPSPKMAAAGAFYMTIRNTGAQADKLIAGKSDACGTVELHESYQMPDGTMGMRMVTGGAIDVPAGGTVELKVGGLHIMCIQKKVEFTKGVKIPLTLTFEKSGNMTVEAEIREQ